VVSISPSSHQRRRSFSPLFQILFWTLVFPRGGYNLYVFCENEPLDEIDPRGLCPKGWDLYALQLIGRKWNTYGLTESWVEQVQDMGCNFCQVIAIEVQCKVTTSHSQTEINETCQDPTTYKYMYEVNYEPDRTTQTIGDCHATHSGLKWSGPCDQQPLSA
jgi:hypothetical protein